ncbi:MAG: hypothetical protein HYZ18_15140 [Pseudogulbenkiania sp.]|nr:hypothetical protein [Pseudogulbenkiania sp.]
MEIALDVGGHHACICCSTDLTNKALCIAVIGFDGATPHLSMLQKALYWRLKAEALDQLTHYLGVAPLVVEPVLPYWPERRAVTARST